MRLAKVEIQGFKSFADRTVIRFDGDVMCIVGPNGCGKSNIADAIRWGMGEQSTKRLRAQEMENVVFAGSDSRGPMSMAEVTLHFENDGTLSHALYGACGEISITRRYFHDEQSDYFINNVPCRLKDVTELLSAAGASSRLYSVIEQGRIGWIVMSKPEEKRALVDEAAGVSIAKAKIASIERKIEKTSINLARLGDVVKEMESTLGSLRRQAQKARRFQEYQEKLCAAELHVASLRYLELLRRASSSERRLAAVEERKQELEAGAAGCEARIERMGAQVVELEERLAALQGELFGMQNRSSLLSSSIEKDLVEIRALEERARGDAEEIDRTAARAGECRGELEGLRRQRDELGGRIARGTEALGAIMEELDAVKAEQAEVARRGDENRAGMVGCASRAASLAAKKEECARIVESLERAIQDTSTGAAAAGSRISHLEMLIYDKSRLKDQARETLRDIAESRGRLEEFLALKKDEIAALGVTMEEVDGQLLALHTQLKSLEASLHEATAPMKSAEAYARETSSSLLSEVIECAEGYEKAVSAVLERLLGCVVVEDVGAAIEHVRLLRARGAGDVEFVARSLPSGDAAPPAAPAPAACGWREIVPLREKVSVPDGRFAGLVDRLLADVFVVDSLETGGSLLAAFAPRASFVTREGEVLSAAGSVLVAGERRSPEQLLRLEGAVAAQRRKADALARRREELAATREGLRGAIQSSASQIASLVASLHEEEKSLVRLQEELTAATNELQSVTARRVELAASLAASVAAQDDARRELAAADDELPRVAEETACAGELQREIDGLVDEVRRRIEEKMVRVGAQRSALETLERDGVRTGEQLERTARTIEELEERAGRLAGEILQHARVQGRKRAEVFLNAERREETELRMRETGAAIEEARGRLADLRFKSREQEAALRALRRRLEENGAELLELRSALITVGGETERLVREIELRWRRDLRLEVYEHHNKPLPGEDEVASIDELRRVLERMGPVNLLAIDEFQTTQARYDAMVGEKADVEAALQDFQVAIARMNKECRRRFHEAFTAISARFAEVFPTVFNGGKAYLELLDPARPLESGVEIKAQLPGKKLGNLDMMSGGEKALTAIALIFAIFQYRPSPFCILDEVDAPLDDVNVKRFNELLRTMTSRSQFILMTHSKLTMQQADILFGVTMEEPGISKILVTRIGGAAAAATATAVA